MRTSILVSYVLSAKMSFQWYFRLHYTVPWSIPKKVAGKKSGAFKWNDTQGGEQIFSPLKLSLLTELTSLCHWTMTRWLFLKTKIWCIIHFSLKLKVKCEYSFIFCSSMGKKNVARVANKVLNFIKCMELMNDA